MSRWAVFLLSGCVAFGVGCESGSGDTGEVYSGPVREVVLTSGYKGSFSANFYPKGGFGAGEEGGAAYRIDGSPNTLAPFATTTFLRPSNEPTDLVLGFDAVYWILSDPHIESGEPITQEYLEQNAFRFKSPWDLD